MSSTQSTTDHEVIRKWVEERDGTPSKVAGRGEGGILRIDFGKPEENLEKISWDDFFEVFDDRQLAFLYQDKTSDGKPSRFNKFVAREGA
ncbi:hypothetical protein [Phyllobacterium endophyticum]|uniref:1,4-alpha-glucan branching enzyme n=1 Tax=Phyllobacterium endophyticum TaxID=1149773 RepID=A0A2P7ASP3_9HYPH|nr:hypothetical protein [Phyllobacterium endophyticum]MBB3236516.1 hypothetical protein [Phyllobacterium endophyticum]PSH57245.1 hypothetical protein CU100_16145 [Phyllobacterium endophyticum]TXR49648.1 hypothetical protein FVA77_08325 [Phyllobacterium endophyticum]TYR39526.1 hypothetical protein FY050_20785 [Phyllobacterium endophyticum]